MVVINNDAFLEVYLSPEDALILTEKFRASLFQTSWSLL